MKGNHQKILWCTQACIQAYGGVSTNGKMVFRTDDGKATEFTDPITDEKFESCYEKDATFDYNSGHYLDTANSLPLRVCRSILCALHLFPEEDVYASLDLEDKAQKRNFYLMVMHHIRYGLLNVTNYQPGQKKWKDYHMQACFIIAMFIHKNQKEKILDVKIT